MSARIADYVVVGIAVLSLPFIAGMGIGEDKARAEIATVCERQPGEGPLIATHQDRNSVICVFDPAPRPGYGKAITKRKATRT